MPVHKLLFKMSLPAIVSMLIQSCYNIVDSIFVAMVSENALEAVTIAFPMQMLIIAFAAGLGVGANAVISRKLGERKPEEANLAAQTGFFLTLITAAVFVIIGFFAVKPFISSFTSNPDTMSMGISYLSIVLIFSSGAFIDIYNGKVFQSTGNMKIPMLTQISGAVVNIILDPLMIFGIGIFPEMGVRGAAIATVCGQFFAMIMGVLIMAFTKQEVKSFFTRKFALKKQIIWEILKISVPTIILKSINSITVTILNTIIKGYEYAITVLGVFFKLQSFVNMPVFGLTQGALPILAYNYGAADKKRFSQTFKLTIISAFCIMLLGFIVFQSLPRQLMLMFGAEGGLMAMGINALRILSISFLFASVTITVTMAFQSLGNGFAALMLSLLRQIILLLPLSLLMLKLLGIMGIWWAHPIAECIIAAIFLPLMIKTINKKFNSLSPRTIPKTESFEL